MNEDLKLVFWIAFVILLIIFLFYFLFVVIGHYDKKAESKRLYFAQNCLGFNSDDILLFNKTCAGYCEELPTLYWEDLNLSKMTCEALYLKKSDYDMLPRKVYGSRTQRGT